MKRATCQQCAVKHISQARAWLLTVDPWAPEALCFGVGHLDQASDELRKDLPELAHRIKGVVDTIMAATGMPDWAQRAMVNLGSARALFLEYLSGYAEHLWFALGKLAEAESALVTVRPQAAATLRQLRLEIEHDATQPVRWECMAMLCWMAGGGMFGALRSIPVPDYAALVARVIATGDRKSAARWRATAAVLRRASTANLKERLGAKK